MTNQEQPTPHTNQLQQIETLRREIEKGIEQADRSELVDGEAVFSNIRVKSHNRRQRSQQQHTYKLAKNLPENGCL